MWSTAKAMEKEEEEKNLIRVLTTQYKIVMCYILHIIWEPQLNQEHTQNGKEGTRKSGLPVKSPGEGAGWKRLHQADSSPSLKSNLKKKLLGHKFHRTREISLPKSVQVYTMVY